MACILRTPSRLLCDVFGAHSGVFGVVAWGKHRSVGCEAIAEANGGIVFSFMLGLKTPRISRAQARVTPFTPLIPSALESWRCFSSFQNMLCDVCVQRHPGPCRVSTSASSSDLGLGLSSREIRSSPRRCRELWQDLYLPGGCITPSKSGD